MPKSARLKYDKQINCTLVAILFSSYKAAKYDHKITLLLHVPHYNIYFCIYYYYSKIELKTDKYPQTDALCQKLYFLTNFIMSIKMIIFFIRGIKTYNYRLQTYQRFNNKIKPFSLQHYDEKISFSLLPRVEIKNDQLHLNKVVTLITINSHNYLNDNMLTFL